jgi:hypothetical protein
MLYSFALDSIKSPKQNARVCLIFRARLEQTAAALEEQNRRLQYELADALHTARTQRDVSTELTRQLAKVQKNHAAALEDKLELQLRLRQADAELEYVRQMEQPPKELSRELTAEKERARRGVLTIRKLRAEVGTLRARVLAAERRNANKVRENRLFQFKTTFNLKFNVKIVIYFNSLT